MSWRWMKNILANCVVPRNDLLVEEEKLKTETRSENYLTRIKKRARKIEEEPLLRPLKKKEKLEVKFIKTVPLHPRDRVARKTKESNDIKVKKSSDNIKITKVTPQHLRDRLVRIIIELNKAADKILLTKVTPHHLRDRLL